MGQVLDIAFPDSTAPHDRVHESRTTERHAIDTLFTLVAEFDEAREEPDGLKRIFARYSELGPRPR